MADDLEREVRRLTDRLEDFENQAEALAALPERVADLRDALKDIRTALQDFRDDCRGRLDALTREHPNGGYQAKASRVDFKTWILFMSSIVVPVVVVLLSK